MGGGGQPADKTVCSYHVTYAFQIDQMVEYWPNYWPNG